MVNQQVGVRPAVDGDLDAVADIFAHYVTLSLVTFEQFAPTVEAWKRRWEQLQRHRLPFLGR